MNNWLKQQLIYQPVIRESKINIIPEQETTILPKKKIKTTSLEGYTPTLLKEPQEKVIIEIPQEETKYPKVFQNKSEFIKVMTPLYEKILASKGIDTSFAKALVQQSGLESNWGKSQSGKFNLGGIKGKGTKRRTREVINGKDQYIYDSFRDFNSLEDYANYHVNLLNNNRYRALSGTVNEFADKVAKGGYATDPRYKNILSKMIASAKFGMKVPKYQYSGKIPSTDIPIIRYKTDLDKEIEKKNNEYAATKDIENFAKSRDYSENHLKELADSIKNTEFNYPTVLHLINGETSFEIFPNNNASSAQGPFQLLESTIKRLYPKNYAQIINEYRNKSRNFSDILHDGMVMFREHAKRIKDGDRSYGRLKVNHLAPYSSQTDTISATAWKSIKNDIKKKLIFGKSTYQDLTDAYNEEYERIFNNNEAYDHSKQKFK